MKKNKFIGAMLITTIIAASCSDGFEQKAEDIGTQLPKTITLGINTPAQTRLTHEYDDGTKILKIDWKQGDVVRVFGTSGYTDYTANADGANGEPVAFTAVDGGTASGDSYNIFYPASKAGDTWDATTINMLGQMQTDAGETAHLADYTFLAKKGVTLADPSGVHLEHQTAIIRIDVTTAGMSLAGIHTLTLSTQDGENITTLQSADGTTTGTSKQLTVAVTTTDASQSAIYMAVLPSMFDGGKPIRLSLVSKVKLSYHTYYQVNVGSDKKYQAGNVYNTILPDFSSLGTFEDYYFSDGAEQPTTDGDGVYIIDNPKKLKWIAEKVNSGTDDWATQKYKLTCDIYIDENQKWIPIGTFDKPFAGHFDGGGHTINGQISFSGAIQYVGVFGYLRVADGVSGSITNLHVAADIIGTDVEAFGATSGYGGIFGGLMNQGAYEINNCSYTGTISIAYKESPTYKCRIGGIGGVLTGKGACPINRCQAIGTINTTGTGTWDEAGALFGSTNRTPINSFSQVTFTGEATP